MALHQTLRALPIPFFIALLFLLVANKVHSQERDSTTFSFSSFTGNERDLTYQGDAFVPVCCRLLRLTKSNISGRLQPEPYSAGRVLYSNPVRLWERGRQASFQTDITFDFRTVDYTPADGIAFFIAPVGSTIPTNSTGGNLGIFGPSGTSSSLFAVEFDTYPNSGWDPPVRHIGIDINSRNSRAVTQLGFLALFEPVVTRITYNASTRMISVFAAAGLGVFRVSYFFDLKTILPEWVQVGISASTGHHVAIHDLRRWSFSSTLVPDRTDNIEKEYNKKLNKDTYIPQYV